TGRRAARVAASLAARRRPAVRSARRWPARPAPAHSLPGHQRRRARAARGRAAALRLLAAARRLEGGRAGVIGALLDRARVAIGKHEPELALVALLRAWSAVRAPEL